MGRADIIILNEDASQVMPIVHEMLRLLTLGLPVPEIKIVNQVRSRFLGQCTWKVGKHTHTGESFCGNNTTIELQKQILGDENTLRRIIAHELCHHEDFLIRSKAEFEKWGFDGYKRMLRFSRDDHGADFLKIAAIFNSHYGSGFVTPKSDESYMLDTPTSTKKLYVLLWKDRDKIYYQVSTRMTPKGIAKVKYCFSSPQPEEYVFTSSTDPFLLKGPTIGNPQGWGYLKDPEKNQKLLDLFKQGSKESV